jgi:rRNA-processing protein EBP2
MAHKKQKSISRPRDEEIKGDTNSKSVQPASSHELDDFDESHDDDSGVDDEGLEKLMNALGKDGLDEFDLAQLRMLSGPAAGEGEEGSDDEENGESSDGKGDGTDTENVPQEEDPGEGEEEEEEAGEGIALDDDDVDSVDQDAIPRRKVQVDNKVRLFPLFTCQFVLFHG